MSNTEMILVRHGESEWNAIGRYQGQLDIPLSKRGEEQAQLAAAWLHSESIAAVISSPLVRALHTAEAIAAMHALQVQIEPALIEIDHGAWQGLYTGEVAQQYPLLLAQWKDDPSHIQMPGGESLADLRRRVLPAIRRIITAWQDKRVVIASHDAILRIILLDALGIDSSRFWQICLDNVGITRLRYTNASLEMPCLLTLNETAHLAHLRADTAIQAL